MLYIETGLWMKNSMIVYADNASITCVSKTALEVMMLYLTEQFRNPLGIYEFAKNAKVVVQRDRYSPLYGDKLSKKAQVLVKVTGLLNLLIISWCSVMRAMGC